MDADIETIMEILRVNDVDLDTRAGDLESTPLHLAASHTKNIQQAAAAVKYLLIEAHANPCVLDSRGRVPYYLATSDKVRDAFRLSRGILGEEYCSWADAKVGSAVTADCLQKKKEKELEKKRRQRERQKAKKREVKLAEEKEQKEREEQERQKLNEEEARRKRTGLKKKRATVSTLRCDFCEKDCSDKRKCQMFSRLHFLYCSTDCVKRHQSNE